MAFQAWVHLVKGFKAACLHHKCEGKVVFSFYSSLISLLPQLFSYLQKGEKTPEINYICLTFQAACCHFAICRPACPVQCGVFTEPLWLSEQRERDPFLLLLAPIQGFLLPFKWAVDEVSLIRLSQLTLVSAVCFPSKGVLTSPILFLYPLLCTFHPGFHPKKTLSAEGPMDSFINSSSPMIQVIQNGSLGWNTWERPLKLCSDAFGHFHRCLCECQRLGKHKAPNQILKIAGTFNLIPE